MLEFKILNNFVDYMESTGLTANAVTFYIDNDFVDEINSNNQSSYSLEELEKATDRCLAHEWIKHISYDDKYANLRITPKGVGVARSKIKAEKLRSSRSRLKKTSDYIEDHKGIFLVLGFLLTISTLALKVFGD
jgi:hypothetical protein